MIGLISLLLTKIKYVGKVLAEAYGVFWGILLLFGVQHFWIWKKWVGVLIGIVVGIGIAVLHHNLFKENIRDLEMDLKSVFSTIKDIFSKIEDIICEILCFIIDLITFLKNMFNKFILKKDINVFNKKSEYKYDFYKTREINSDVHRKIDKSVEENKSENITFEIIEHLANARAELENPEGLTIKKINSRLQNIRNMYDVEKLTNLICIRLNDKRIKNLINALIGYIFSECNENEQNFKSIMLLLNSMEIKEGKIDSVDLLFQELEENDPYNFAVKWYNQYISLPTSEKKYIVERCSEEFSKIK